MEGYSILAIIRSVLKFYLDPGSGSMFIQLIIGSVLGLGVLIRVFWKKIKPFFIGGKSSDKDADDSATMVQEPTDTNI